MTASEIKELKQRKMLTLAELGALVDPPRTERTAWRWTRKGCSSKRSARQLMAALKEARRAKPGDSC